MAVAVIAQMIIVAAPYAYSTPQLRRVRNGRRGSIEPSHSDTEAGLKLSVAIAVGLDVYGTLDESAD
jgi:hypothetical protein